MHNEEGHDIKASSTAATTMSTSNAETTLKGHEESTQIPPTDHNSNTGYQYPVIFLALVSTNVHLSSCTSAAHYVSPYTLDRVDPRWALAAAELAGQYVAS